jgi:hypothetical protein
MATDTEVSAVSAQIPANVAGKNAAINGGFDIWQRGTSFASTGGSYTADRWWSAASGSGSTTISRQAPGSTLPQFQYALRTQRNSGSTETTSQQLGYTLETADSLRFAGQTITVSFYARAGANYSTSGSGLFFLLNTGTGSDQRLLGAGFTGNANILFTSATLSTSWQRFSYQVAIGSTATGIGFYWQANVSGTAGANDWFEITGVQLEIGSSATPFSRAGGDIQGELAACQRYYQRKNSAGNGTIFAMGQCQNTTNAYYMCPTPVQLRVSPSVVTSGVVGWTASTGNAGGTIAVFQMSPNAVSLQLTGGNSLVAGNASAMAGTTSSAYLELSAEL